MTFKKYCYLCIFCIISFSLQKYCYKVYLNRYFEKDGFQNQKNASMKYILFWTGFWNEKDFLIGYGTKPFKMCKYKNCFATADKHLIPLKDFDALLFHFTYNEKVDGIPWERSPHQKYVYLFTEAPIYFQNLKPSPSYFNWTMSYRYDSDIMWSHGFIKQRKTKYKTPGIDFVQNKTKLIAWFASHCKTSSRRELVVSTLLKYVHVDIYGSCGTLRCQKKPPNFKISSNRCYDLITKKYKFYLSFENSYCEDYATEKLYRWLQKDIVPIVYGGGDYKKMAPPSSTINIEDFRTIEQMVDFLQYLNDNPEEYLKYFEWKKKYEIDTNRLYTICQLCEKLNTEASNRTIYENLEEWWRGPNLTMCKFGTSLHNILPQDVDFNNTNL